MSTIGTAAHARDKARRIATNFARLQSYRGRNLIGADKDVTWGQGSSLIPSLPHYMMMLCERCWWRANGRELKNMRTASLIMLSALFVQVAYAADAIRLSTFPNVMLGTWAETAEQCAAKDKTNIVIAPAKYRSAAIAR